MPLQSYHKLQVEFLKAESHAVLGLFTDHPLFLRHVMHALTFPFTHSMMLLWFKMNATLKVTIEDAMLWHSCLVSLSGVICCATHFIHSRMMLGSKLKRKTEVAFWQLTEKDKSPKTLTKKKLWEWYGKAWVIHGPYVRMAREDQVMI